MKRVEFCPMCEDYRGIKKSVREETYTVRDRQITVTGERELCEVCGETLGSDAEDDTILNAVYAEYRRQTGLLTPDEIQAIRKRYRLSQKSFAALLGMSEATVNRYEKGIPQEHTHDNLIRACENPQFIRDLLERRGRLISDWQRRRAEAALAEGAPSAA